MDPFDSYNLRAIFDTADTDGDAVLPLFTQGSHSPIPQPVSVSPVPVSSLAPSLEELSCMAAVPSPPSNGAISPINPPSAADSSRPHPRTNEACSHEDARDDDEDGEDAGLAPAIQ